MTSKNHLLRIISGIIFLLCTNYAFSYSTDDLVLISTANKDLDAQKRLIRSATVFQYEIFDASDLETEEIKGSATYLRKALAKLNPGAENDRTVLFIDGPFSVLAAGPKRVVEEFDLSRANILTSSTGTFTGSDETLKRNFPKVEAGRRFMDAGALVGKALSLYELLKEFPDENNIQEILLKALDKPALRKKYQIKVDHKCNLFQNLPGATADLDLRFIGKEAYIQNEVYKTVPVVIRADVQTSTILNNYGSYIARAWNSEDGCRECWENMNSLEEVKDEDLPSVMLVLSIHKPTPFFEEFLQTIDELTYPRKKIDLFVHNTVEFHEEEITTWVHKTKNDFKSHQFISFTDTSTKEWHSKNMALEELLKGDASFVFFVDSEARLDNPHALKLLIEQNRSVLSPMLPRPGKTWSNFWGALTSDGFYARSHDYVEIVQNDRRGLWNVPYVSTCLLIKRELVKNLKTKLPFIKNLLDPDMAFCEHLRNEGVFMYVSNRVDFGHMISAEGFNIFNKNPEIWQLIENRWDWEKRYLHENYSQSFNESLKIAQPCPDVYWFPIFTERFAKEMIEIMENYGQWSDGSHMDKRLEGGYETVPTVDIHMNQVSYNDEWHEILRAYVQPLQLRVYDGYYNDVGVRLFTVEGHHRFCTFRIAHIGGKSAIVEDTSL